MSTDPHHPFRVRLDQQADTIDQLNADKAELRRLLKGWRHRYYAMRNSRELWRHRYYTTLELPWATLQKARRRRRWETKRAATVTTTGKEQP